ncbi:MAG: hypothetical protein CR967_01560 [Proteobacteria bacterium]|nr:MAG: hypothetical protein CR967_01560 [Pseudomonadota bacterium]
MKQIFEIKDKKIIQNLLDEIGFGILSLCKDNIPYSLPLNFVFVDDTIYFHGAKKGQKVDVFTSNSKASFCVVKEYSFIPSYFSTDDGRACPATQFQIHHCRWGHKNRRKLWRKSKSFTKTHGKNAARGQVYPA